MEEFVLLKTRYESASRNAEEVTAKSIDKNQALQAQTEDELKLLDKLVSEHHRIEEYRTRRYEFDQ